MFLKASIAGDSINLLEHIASRLFAFFNLILSEYGNK